MKKEKLLRALEYLYEFYDHFLEGFNIACAPGCDTCCSINVFATSLELSFITEHKAACTLIQDIKEELEVSRSETLYRPINTTNELASFFLRREEPPPDHGEHGKGKCPFLTDRGLCAIYEWRPFACRAMTSQKMCAKGDQADMDPFLVQLNLALYQVIEHLDANGVCGNFLDLVSFFALDNDEAENFLIRNRPLPGFLIDPSDKGRFMAFLRRLARHEKDLGIFSSLVTSST